ncbi:PLG [Mytilus edulis]|uniref:PLG n=1 Tax=Mytilus edulis TaxID=6550 RepID=A0A8S3TKP4_MYTED|nr:PLG [Mytilus edulis]
MFNTIIVEAKECLQNTEGLAYKGTVSTTRTGINCSSWSGIAVNNEVQTHQHNYCRNPDADPKGPWCFTSDPDVFWEHCSIPLCDDVDITTKLVEVTFCLNQRSKTLYRYSAGCRLYWKCEYVSTTDTGKTCQDWSQTYPHLHDFTAKLGDQQNYCRNPDNEPLGPWCYTTDPASRWEYCTVPLCEQNCRMNQQGKNYTGKINKTRFGQKCQAWSSLVPHEHPFAVKLADDEDYCRNQNTELYGPWCYTTDTGTRWEYCDVPYCGKDNWKYGWQEHKGSVYIIQYTEKSWVDAKNFCINNHTAYLAEIQTNEENEFLMNLLPKPTADNGDIDIWLGARDLKVNGQFTWTNSSTNLDFTDWGPKEPNGRYEECLATH